MTLSVHSSCPCTLYSISEDGYQYIVLLEPVLSELVTSQTSLAARRKDMLSQVAHAGEATHKVVLWNKEHRRYCL